MIKKENIRLLVKKSIVVFDKLTRWLPYPKVEVLVLTDFEGNCDNLICELADYKVKHLQFKKGKALITAFYVRRAKVIYVDNINIVISSLENIDGTIIQVWHATSAVKKFGLPTVDDPIECQERMSEYEKYDYVTVNSTFMAEKFISGFGFGHSHIKKTGCLQSKQLFECEEINPFFEYIVYTPTFRWDRKNDQQAIDFITNFKSSKYKLIYSLHPKLEITIDNLDAIDVSGTDIRSYFKNASLVISDYSSLLIDASLNCPNAVMYAYDYNEYNQETGLYINRDNFWGYYTECADDLVDYIANGNFQSHDLSYIKQRFFTYDDIDSTKRIANLATEIL